FARRKEVVWMHHDQLRADELRTAPVVQVLRVKVNDRVLEPRDRNVDVGRGPVAEVYAAVEPGVRGREELQRIEARGVEAIGVGRAEAVVEDQRRCHFLVVDGAYHQGFLEARRLPVE